MAIGYNNEEGVISGMRNSSEVIVEVDVPLAMKDGYKFLRSKNDVILCAGKGPEGQIPPGYFKNVIYKKKGGQPVHLDIKPFDYLLVLDFEANCVESGSLPCQEIIEFPVVPIDVKTRTALNDKVFHTYVKPTVVPTLSEFCTQLTGIKQVQVNSGKLITQVLDELDVWMNTNGFTPENSTFVTCGRWDLNTCLKKEAAFKKIDLKQYLRKFINVKDAWMAMNFCSKATGMPGMLESYGHKLEGRHHSGIDDSKNIAKIVISLLEEHAAFTKLQEIFTDKEND
jgi:inhibitor of KinA sporulation pathway (predicted exonuclease)